MLSRSRRTKAPMARFSATERRGRPRPSGTRAIPVGPNRTGRRVISWPRKRTAGGARDPGERLEGAGRFPAPLAPMSATVSPSATWKVMPRTARIPPYATASPVTSKQGRLPGRPRSPPDSAELRRGRPRKSCVHSRGRRPGRQAHDQLDVVFDEQHRRPVAAYAVDEQAQLPVSVAFIPAAGSSRQRRRGSVARARAISSRRWSP